MPALMEGPQLAELWYEQRIGLNVNVSAALFNEPETGIGSTPWMPTSTLAAVRTAGQLVRGQRKLAKKSIERDDSLRYSTAASALINIVNATVDRSADKPGISLSGMYANAETCSLAEKRFLETINTLPDMSPEGIMPIFTDYPDIGAQIIHHHGRPIILRKKYDVKSALTLETLNINGAPCPPGSLISVDYRFRRPPMPNIVEIVPHTDINGISFERLSAFALRPKERSDVFKPDSPADHQDFGTITMAQIRHKVRRAFSELKRAA